jgi:hypothetical protein
VSAAADPGLCAPFLWVYHFAPRLLSLFPCSYFYYLSFSLSVVFQRVQGQKAGG